MPLLAGTAAVSEIATLLTTPIGLSAAIYSVMFARPSLQQTTNIALGILGTVPSVVLGLWATTWLVPIFGNSLASATLVVAIMILPTFTLLTAAALRQVPSAMDENLRALGINDDVRAWVLLQNARHGVGVALTLAICRALGEAVAVYLVAGNIPRWPSSPLAPVSTLTTTIVGELDVATGLHRSALHGLGLLVVGLIMAVSISGRRKLEPRKSQHSEWGDAP